VEITNQLFKNQYKNKKVELKKSPINKSKLIAKIIKKNRPNKLNKVNK
jgi:hypothetical protein